MPTGKMRPIVHLQQVSLSSVSLVLNSTILNIFLRLLKPEVVLANDTKSIGGCLDFEEQRQLPRLQTSQARALFKL